MFVQGRGAGAKPHTVPRRRATLVGAYPIVVVYRQGVERAGSVRDKETRGPQGVPNARCCSGHRCCGVLPRDGIPGYDLS
jgi:hypothetical protein